MKNTKSIGTQLGEGFYDAVTEVTAEYGKLKSAGELNAAEEIATGFAAVGVELHERLIDLSKNKGEQLALVNGTVEIFQAMSHRELHFDAGVDGNDPSVTRVITDHVSGQIVERVECTVQEGNEMILHAAIGYGIVAGIASAAATNLKDL